MGENFWLIEAMKLGMAILWVVLAHGIGKEALLRQIRDGDFEKMSAKTKKHLMVAAMWGLKVQTTVPLKLVKAKRVTGVQVCITPPNSVEMELIIKDPPRRKGEEYLSAPEVVPYAEILLQYAVKEYENTKHKNRGPWRKTYLEGRIKAIMKDARIQIEAIEAGSPR